jgi:hypothetical protein
MNTLKATDIVTLRKILREKGADPERVVVERLSPEAKTAYENVLATSWISQAVEKEIMESCLRELFPGEPQGFRLLGKLLAQHNLTGVYKVFLRIPTIEFIMKRVGDLWRMFFQIGSAKVEITAPHHGLLTVSGYPDFMPYQRELVAGYIQGIMGLAGAHQVQTTQLSFDPSAWKWEITWE